MDPAVKGEPISPVQPFFDRSNKLVSGTCSTLLGLVPSAKVRGFIKGAMNRSNVVFYGALVALVVFGPGGALIGSALGTLAAFGDKIPIKGRIQFIKSDAVKALSVVIAGLVAIFLSPWVGATALFMLAANHITHLCRGLYYHDDSGDLQHEWHNLKQEFSTLQPAKRDHEHAKVKA